MATHDDLPKWLGGVNVVVKWLQRLGLSIGTMHVASPATRSLTSR